MNKDQVTEFVSHPLFISFVIWIIIVISLPPLFSKYRIKTISSEYIPEKTSYLYSDLDSDGNSEKISFDFTDAAQTKIIISRDEKVSDQFNIRHQPANLNSVYIGNYNNDKFRECFIFTVSEDSIFLNIIDPLGLQKIILPDRFIDFRVKTIKSFDKPEIVPVNIIHNGSQYGDLVFFITSGFGKKPRSVYRYIIEKDSLVKSTESSVAINGCTIIVPDVNNTPEFVLNVSATGNYDETAPFSDQFTWLMILNRDLQFIFDPVKLSKYPSRAVVLPARSDGVQNLILFNEYFGDKNIPSSICIYDMRGNKLSEISIENFDATSSNIFLNPDESRETFYFLKNRKTEIDELNMNLKVIRTKKIPKVYSGIPVTMIDADNDGEKEYIFQGHDRRTILITRNDFSGSLEYDNYDNDRTHEISQVLKQGIAPMLCLRTNDKLSYVCYQRNPLYYLKYPAFGALYLLIFMFISLIYRLQKYRMDQKQDTERKIASLQIKAIKNQIDPHFTLNILNAIGSLYASDENRNNADYIFGKYAKLLRQTVISSDQIIISLADEIEFVRNYLDLESFRSNNSFEYDLELSPGVDERMNIPRTLIHTFVENAIKYGIRKKPNGGKINIFIRNSGKVLQIIVEDNGPGLDLNDKSGNGTGKGLAIINELIDLYYKLEKSKISYKLCTMYNPDKIPSGTRVIIEMAS